MPARLDVRDPNHPTRVLMVVSNPAESSVTGWPVGFWLAELTHPWLAFTEAGYDVTVASPDGGALRADTWSDPRDESGYSAHDLVSLGFVTSPMHAQLLEDTPRLEDLDLGSFDVVFLVGGQAPMFTFRGDERIHALLRGSLAAGKVVAVVCHATAALLDAIDDDGRLLVADRTWTGFANSEERFADEYVGTRIQPFWIQDVAEAIEGTNFIVRQAFAPHAVRDGNLVTGQQQYSGLAAAELVIEAVGI